MADPDVSHSSSTDEDQDFEPSCEDVTNQEMDDERTLDEEEALSNEESVANELDDLHKESEIPVEVLLAMYGYSSNKQASSSSQGVDTVESSEDKNDDNQAPSSSTTTNNNDDDNMPSSSSNLPSSSNQKQDGNLGEIDEDNVKSNFANDNEIVQNESLQDEKHVKSDGKSSITTSTTVVEAMFSSASSKNDESNEGKIAPSDADKSNKSQGLDIVESSNGSGLPPSTADLLSSDLMDVGSDDDEDYDPEQEEDWKKSVSIGPEYQAVVPEYSDNNDDYYSYEMEDRMLWSPNELNESDVEAYLLEVHRQHQLKNNNSNANNNLPFASVARDDEQALYLLRQCNNDFEEALRRQKLQAYSQPDPMSLWTEEECRSFETGLRLYGKDFFLNQQKVKTRSVREIVQFYYLWKKTERHDAFTARTRMEKKKYNLHPGVTDYMDRFISEFETPLVDTSVNNHNNSKTCIMTSEMVRRMDASKHANMSFNHYMESSGGQCCDGLMVYCNIPSGVSCSYDDVNSSLFPPSYNNCHLLPSDVSSTGTFYSSSIYEYPTTSSTSNQIPSCSGLSSSYHIEHLSPQPDLSCYPSQVDSTYMPSGNQVFGGNICNSPTSFHTNPSYYPVVDSIPSSSFANKQDCLMPEVDMDSLIASSQMSSVSPQELSISDINIIFGNVERPSCEVSNNSNTPVVSNGDRCVEMIGSGENFSGVSCMALSSDTPAYLPPSMQKLCSDDGGSATLESISASIQELVDPESAMSPENLLSVLEGNNVNSSGSTSSIPANPSSNNQPLYSSSFATNSYTESTHTSLHVHSSYLSDDKISSCSGFNNNIQNNNNNNIHSQSKNAESSYYQKQNHAPHNPEQSNTFFTKSNEVPFQQQTSKASNTRTDKPSLASSSSSSSSSLKVDATTSTSTPFEQFPTTSHHQQAAICHQSTQQQEQFIKGSPQHLTRHDFNHGITSSSNLIIQAPSISSDFCPDPAPIKS